MPCNLPPEALFILSVLYKRRCFRTDAGYHSDKLKKIFLKKYPSRSSKFFDTTIKVLLNDGYMGQIRKKKIKYYLNYDRSVFALKSHGYDVVTGSIHKL